MFSSVCDSVEEDDEGGNVIDFLLDSIDDLKDEVDHLRRKVDLNEFLLRKLVESQEENESLRQQMQQLNDKKDHDEYLWRIRALILEHYPDEFWDILRMIEEKMSAVELIAMWKAVASDQQCDARRKKILDLFRD